MFKFVKWTLIVLGLLIALGIALAIAGVGDTTDKHKARRHAKAKGTRSKPIPLHEAARIGGGWRLRVLSVTRNANGLVSEKPPAGAQAFIARVALTYKGGGKDSAGALVRSEINAMGAHRASYDYGSDSCVAYSGLNETGDVYSGRTVRGNMCFQIAANDARSLMLYTGGRFANTKRVWFVLR